MLHFPTPEGHDHLHFHPFPKKILGLPQFGRVIVRIDVHVKLHFLHLGGQIVPFRLPLPLVHLVPVLPEIQNLTNRRIAGPTHLHQIQPRRPGRIHRIIEIHDAPLLTRRVHQEHLAGTDSVIRP